MPSGAGCVLVNRVVSVVLLMPKGSGTSFRVRSVLNGRPWVNLTSITAGMHTGTLNLT